MSGHAEGRAEGLRQAVRALCEALEIPLSPERDRALESLELAALEAVVSELRSKRAWPD